MRFSHRKKTVLKLSIAAASLLIYCEYLIYYVVLFNCDWPELNPKNEDATIKTTSEEPVKAMVLADTHLLGSRKGHWFDKLRREWQMSRTFKTAMVLHKPDIVFVLGDLLDEGSYCSKAEFQYYVDRFYTLFPVPNETQMYVVVGNHDIGFHYGISPYLNQRFSSAFNSPSVQLISIRGNHFVMVNSMALEGDGCFLCKPAELQLARIEKLLRCTENSNSEKCDLDSKLDVFSKPILLQHYPLYRDSDKDCFDFDSAPPPIRHEKFRENWECLSKEATTQLLRQIRPRLVLSGHTHHGCTRPLPNNEGTEITVPSFSWRNKENPTYSLLVIYPNNYAIIKCAMPKELTVIYIYTLGTIFIITYSIYFCTLSQHKYKV